MINPDARALHAARMRQYRATGHRPCVDCGTRYAPAAFPIRPDGRRGRVCATCIELHAAPPSPYPNGTTCTRCGMKPRYLTDRLGRLWADCRCDARLVTRLATPEAIAARRDLTSTRNGGTP